MTPEERLFQDACEALKKKDYTLARDLFTRVLKLNRQNPEYWLGMSMAVETLKERGVCLREVLKLDPENDLAKRGLVLMGEEVANPPALWKMAQYRTNWKTSLELNRARKVRAKLPIRKILGWSFLGILLIAVITGGLLIAETNRYRPDTSPVFRVSLPPSATASLTPMITDTPSGPALLDTNLSTTFTSTPIRAATPHNRTEAYSSALKAYERQDWGRAAELLKQVIAEEPGSADLHYLLGEIYRMQKNYKDALVSYDAAIKANAAYAPSYLGKGRLTLQSTPSKTIEALAFFTKALELDPELSETRLEMANLYLTKGDTDTALTWLESYLDNESPTAVVEYTRARILLLKGEVSAALTAIQKAREMDVSYMPIYQLWGQVLQANERYEESIVPLLTYLNADPTSPESELLLAKAYYYTGDTERALATIQKVISVSDKVIDAYLLRGDIYMDQGKLVEADNSYLRAQQLYYRSFGGYIGRARVQLAKTYAGGALINIEKAMEAAATPREEAIALYWRAVSMVGLKNSDAAIRDYEAFFALPAEVAPKDLLAQAREEYLTIVTPTPSLTPTITFTPAPTKTFTPTFTTTATVKVTTTSISSASPTPSPTK